MDKILEITDNLTKEIRNSYAYKQYFKCYDEIINDDELRHKVEEFKNVNKDLKNKKNNGEEISFEYEKYVSRLYHSLILNDTVKVYFECEQRLIEILNNIYEKIYNECKIDL